MIVAVSLNMLWIVWVLYTFFTGFESYEGLHAHTYAYSFFAGLLAIILGTVWLKVLYFRNRRTPMVRVGLGLWLLGFLMIIISTFLGANLPSAHVLKEHVLFNHTNFLIFLLGTIVSVFSDTLIVSRLDRKNNSSDG